MKLPVKVVPGASRNGIVGWLGENLKVRVSAPPERGKANAAVETLICEVLELPKGSVLVVAGKTSPHKTVEISGLTKSTVLERLGKPGTKIRSD